MRDRIAEDANCSDEQCKERVAFARFHRRVAQGASFTEGCRDELLADKRVREMAQLPNPDFNLLMRSDGGKFVVTEQELAADPIADRGMDLDIQARLGSSPFQAVRVIEDPLSEPRYERKTDAVGLAWLAVRDQTVDVQPVPGLLEVTQQPESCYMVDLRPRAVVDHVQNLSLAPICLLSLYVPEEQQRQLIEWEELDLFWGREERANRHARCNTGRRAGAPQD